MMDMLLKQMGIDPAKMQNDMKQFSAMVAEMKQKIDYLYAAEMARETALLALSDKSHTDSVQQETGVEHAGH